MDVLMNQDLLELYQSGKNKRYKDGERNCELLDGFIRAVKTMMIVNNVSELSGFSYLHYEQLKYQWSGYSSVRLSNRYVHRLIFTETAEGLEVELIEIDETHYGNK
jgi:plasmid maintenance system killer protein